MNLIFRSRLEASGKNYRMIDPRIVDHGDEYDGDVDRFLDDNGIDASDGTALQDCILDHVYMIPGTVRTSSSGKGHVTIYWASPEDYHDAAEMIRRSDNWFDVLDHIAILCDAAGMSELWEKMSFDGEDDFESVIYTAAEKLGVQII